ncbi:glycosyltransferase family 4 protein [Paenibacillus thermotolerans]|uniref:glycosyltransferase family 4 protein n=1 Tax=Paenibacillus thermotolerans TaxID=3027807 RepID=UPI00236747A3|nr:MULTISPECIES: glycosyltransferase family 4 protein [unclassified Paenibacillus]
MVNKSSPTVWVMTTEYAPSIIGGLGTVATELTKTLKKLNVNVTVISSKKAGKVSLTGRNGVNIVRIPLRPPYFHRGTKSFNGSQIESIAQKYGLKKPDLLHIHSLEYANAALALKRKYQVPIVYTCHSLIRPRSPRNSLQNSLIRNAKVIVSPSRWLKGKIRSRYPARIAANTVVIPNGVRPVSSRASAPPYRLLFVGRLIKEKGIEPLVRSISILARRDKRVKLTVVGKALPRYRSRLQAIARRIGIRSRVRWLGFQRHGKVQRLYASYGSVVVPSKEESFCLVALEAMANGIPLVATRAGGLREFVNRRNAQIIEAVQPNSIARAVQAMWDHPERTRIRVIRARNTARSFNWRLMALAYKRLFQKLT